jgi:gliding motility-associated-like protein
MAFNLTFILLLLTPIFVNGQVNTESNSIIEYNQTCYNPYITLSAPNGASEYLWSTGDTTRQLIVSMAGVYKLMMKKGSTYLYDSVRIGFPFNNSYNNNWLMYDSIGITFNNGKKLAKAIDGVKLKTSMPLSLSDKNGALWFYTDGVNIYNRDNEIMENGNDLHYDGVFGNSFPNKNIFCHYPGKDSVFFLLSPPPAFGNIQYSIIDMTKNNGKGAVTHKKIIIDLGTAMFLNQGVVVRHSNLKDFWWVVKQHGTLNFYSFLITENGINTTPVISSAGFETNATLTFKSSPDGNKLCIFDDFHNKFEILTFDPSAGIVYNPLEMYIDEPRSFEFSPDGKKIYFAAFSLSGLGLFQYDLELYNASSISSSMMTVGNLGWPGVPDMRIGADGKIYTNSELDNYYGVIQSPNSKGVACTYIKDNIYTNKRLATIYFPPPFLSNRIKEIQITGKTLHCNYEDSVVYYLKEKFVNAFWKVEGSAVIKNVTDTSIALGFNKDGKVVLTAGIQGCNTISIASLTIEVRNAKVFLGKDTLVCGNIQNYTLNPGKGYTSYLWNDKSTNDYFLVDKAGTYSVEVKNKNCIGSDTIVIRHAKIPSLNFKDTAVCEGEIFTFDAGDRYDDYIWQDGSKEQIFSATSAGKYKVQVSNACGVAKDSANLSINPVPIVKFSGLDNSYCFSRDEIILTGIPSGGRFEGPGIFENKFISAEANLGVNTIQYIYKNSFGCIGKESITTEVNDDCYFAPNLLTVNGDLKNDHLLIKGIANKSTLTIYDRWGTLVYENTNYYDQWQAENIPSGVYYYSLDSPSSGRSRKGWIQVIKD